MSHKELFDLHVQLLSVYEKHRKSPSPYEGKIQYYRQQYFFTKDIVQKIFVLNQLVNLHEKSRAEQLKWCSELYFNGTITEGEKQINSSEI